MNETIVAETLVSMIKGFGFEAVIEDEDLGCTDEQCVWAKDGSHTVATFLLVWGNASDGEELIADYIDNEIGNEIYSLTMAHCGFDDKEDYYE
jgi:hypothetical protein